VKYAKITQKITQKEQKFIPVIEEEEKKCKIFST